MSTELAWAAGFFDGDGNVSAYYRESRGTLTLQMVVTQKDRRPLQRLHTVLGVGRIYEVHPTARPERHWYQWQFGYLIIPVRWTAITGMYFTVVVSTISAIDYFVGFWKQIDRASKDRRSSFVLSRRKNAQGAN